MGWGYPPGWSKPGLEKPSRGGFPRLFLAFLLLATACHAQMADTILANYEVIPNLTYLVREQH